MVISQSSVYVEVVLSIPSSILRVQPRSTPSSSLLRDSSSKNLIDLSYQTAIMKGVVVTAPGEWYKPVDDLEKPVPGPGQVLVKSQFSGINPVEGYMQTSGLMVTSWPIVLGCDSSGTVVEVGQGVTKYKVGDGIFGCTRLGVKGYGTFQEFHIMDEKLSFKRPSHISPEGAATIGVGVLTSSLGLFIGLGLHLAAEGKSIPPPDEEWLLVLGGSGSVGQCAIQLASDVGYKVLVSCSPGKRGVCIAAGASATFDYKLPVEEQVETVSSITGGKFAKIMDAGAASYTQAMEILMKATTSSKKRFASTDDWSGWSSPPGSGIEIYRIKLGGIGRFGESEEADEINEHLTTLFPSLQALVDGGKITPLAYEVIGKGFNAVPDAVKLFQSGKVGAKKSLVAFD